ncbi:hypothetical protein GmRootA79_37430 [Acidovorax sp. A79]
MPPPKSSTPRKPRREEFQPELASWVLFATLPDPCATLASMIPKIVIDDWAKAVLAKIMVATAIRDLRIRAPTKLDLAKPVAVVVV